jgi:muramoyltetrapeptide carboxypeptidase
MRVVGSRADASLLRPHALPRGGTLGICSPAGPVEEALVREGSEWLRGEGFEVALAPHTLTRRGYLSGSDDERLGDFLELLRDPGIDAIYFSRGGYGTARWLPRVEAGELRAARKLVMGYSDATSVLLFLRRCAGLASIHCPMLRSDMTPGARARLLALACGEAEGLAPLAGEGLRGGVVEAPLVGGNLTLVTGSLGTPWEIDTQGAILFLEEVAEQPYAIDRLLTQLRNAGKLEQVAGVALGRFAKCESERYPEVSSADVLREILEGAFKGPIVTGLPFGHVADNLALAVGVRARLDGGSGTLALLEPAVAARGQGPRP